MNVKNLGLIALLAALAAGLAGMTTSNAGATPAPSHHAVSGAYAAAGHHVETGDAPPTNNE
jgi:Flp pilus assembly protein CpaB